MKKHLFSLVALGLLFVTASAHAQTVNLKANVPFDFIVNQQTMPKGEYTVKSIGTLGSEALLVQNVAGSSVEGLLIGHSKEAYQPASVSKMVFHRYGDQYFLAQVWTLGNSAGQEFPKSSREKELAKAATASKIIVAANQ